MASNKLTILDKKLPLRGYPEDALDNILESQFKYWVSNLLSIKSDNEDKVNAALPAIKNHFWSLGLDQVKKAFEMYADGKLNIEPKSNYFDRILVGQIFKEYRKIKPPLTPKVSNEEISEARKNEIIENGVKRCENEYREYGMVLPGNHHIYEHLHEKGIIKPSKQEKKQAMLDAAVSLKNSSSILKKYVRSEERTIVEAKRLLLEKYFEKRITKNNQ